MASDLPLFSFSADGRDGFVVGSSNAAVLALLSKAAYWPSGTLWLTGPAGAGKSRLAKIWAEENDARLLCGQGMAEVSLISLIEGPGKAWVVDNAETVPTERLFDFLNLAREASGQLLLVSRLGPAELVRNHPDLASRLSAMPVATLLEPDEDMAPRLLLALAAQSGFVLSPTAAQYGARVLGRTYARAHEWVARLQALAEPNVGLPQARSSLIEGFDDDGE